VNQPIPSDIEALRTAFAAEQQARREAEARASGAEAMVAHLKLLIAKMKRDRFGASAERGRKLLDQLEMQLEELETAAAEHEAVAANAASDKTIVRPFTRAKPVRGPLPAHLPRERVVLASPSSCPCCGGKLAKLGETITETLESIPRTYKVIQTVREKFSCRSCETITQPPAPFHPIAPRTCWRLNGFMATTRPCRCWPKTKRSSLDYGPTYAMIAHSAGRHRRR
jgi:transposase